MARLLRSLAVVLVLSTTASAAPLWSGASWIWDTADAAQSPTDNEPRFVRYAFELKAKATAAEIHITADNEYELYVNGQKIGADQSWHKAEKYDIAKHLVAGKNVIAAMVRNQGGVAGAIAWASITTADKRTVVIGTGKEWKVSLKAPEGWKYAGFDDAAWAAAGVLGPATIGPWNIGGSAPADTSAPPNKDFQSPDKELADFLLPEGFKAELVDAEPNVVNPVSLAMDQQGRLYFGESHTYRWGPAGSPYPKPTNPIVMLDPLPGGGYKRVVVAEGFADPVMGILVRDGKLWCTANEHLYQYDIDKAGQTSNRRELVLDKNKAWNPFGNFVLEWGPDDLLYMSVGNHDIDLGGPTNRIKSRGGAGIVVRMKPDGSDMEKLVQGLRVPYSFEMDPFGQLWLLSNGEGNPNRFVRVIEGVDYHCYSRSAGDSTWLAGLNPLAPPCFELPGGANTQLMRYYGAAYPAEYQGSLLLVNWGRHGFPSANHAVFRYVPDERNSIVKQETWVGSSDPHFRPTHVLLATDGSVLVTDWYGRDDENDKTGRIWKITYTGADAVGKPAARQFADAKAAIEALGSFDHLARESAMRTLRSQGAAAIAPLAGHAGKSSSPIGAANALWTLVRIGSPQSLSALAAGTKHDDWRVRRLALLLLARYHAAEADQVAQSASSDSDPAVLLAAALARKESSAIRGALLASLPSGVANDAHLRYEAAWHLAKHADATTFSQLLASANPDIRLTGLIAIDVALFEQFESQSHAMQAFQAALTSPGELSLDLLIKLADMNRGPSLIAPLQALLSSNKLSTDSAVQTILMLRALSPAGTDNLGEKASANLLEAIRTGRVPIKTASDAVLVLELLEIEGPTPFALQRISQYLTQGEPTARAQAHITARKFGAKAASLSRVCWERLAAKGVPAAEKVELVGTLAAIDSASDLAKWKDLLESSEAPVATEALRAWRRFAGQSKAVEMLLAAAPQLIKQDGRRANDLRVVLAELKADPVVVAELGLPTAVTEKTQLAEQTLAYRTEAVSATHGRQVFDRVGCAKCHSVTQQTKLAPPLAGIGRMQKPEYLVESILEPSKVIKTGFETESIETDSGQVLSGLVREEGDELVVIESPEKSTKISKKSIEHREVQKKSIMPDGQEKLLSEAELGDLLAYLVSLKVGGAPEAKK